MVKLEKNLTERITVFSDFKEGKVQNPKSQGLGIL